MKEIIMIIIITSMMMKMMMTLTKLNILQKAEAELEAADPPPLLVVDVALVGRAQGGRLPVQHRHPVDGAPVLKKG